MARSSDALVAIVRSCPNSDILWSMEYFPKKITSWITTILDISTKTTLLCFLPALPSNVAIAIALAPLLAEKAYSVILFVIHLTHNPSSMLQLTNK